VLTAVMKYLMSRAVRVYESPKTLIPDGVIVCSLLSFLLLSSLDDSKRYSTRHIFTCRYNQPLSFNTASASHTQ
jgi:hypothetical protein